MKASIRERLERLGKEISFESQGNPTARSAFYMSDNLFAQPRGYMMPRGDRLTIENHVEEDNMKPWEFTLENSTAFSVYHYLSINLAPKQSIKNIYCDSIIH